VSHACLFILTMWHFVRGCLFLCGILSGCQFSAWHFVWGAFGPWHFVLWHFVPWHYVRTPDFANSSRRIWSKNWKVNVLTIYPVELAAELETGSRLPTGELIHTARHKSTRQLSHVGVSGVCALGFTSYTSPYAEKTSIPVECRTLTLAKDRQ